MRELEEIELILEESQSRDDNIYRAIFEADPYPQHKRGLGTGGNPMKYDKYNNIAHRELVIDIAKKIEKIEKQLVAQSRSYDEVIELIKTKGEILHSIPSIQPINNADLTTISIWLWNANAPYLQNNETTCRDGFYSQKWNRNIRYW